MSKEQSQELPQDRPSVELNTSADGVGHAAGDAVASKGAESGGGAPPGQPTAAVPEGVNVTAGNLSAEGNAYIGSTHQDHRRQDNRHQEFIDNSVRNFFGSHETSFWKTFSPDYMMQVSAEVECRLAESHISDGELFEGLCATLKEKRLLVLTGEAGIGKTTTALCLSSRLRQIAGDPGATYLVRPLDRNVKIDFRQIARRSDEYGGRVLLFQDAFARGNRDAVDFFTQIGRPALDGITEQLQQSHSCLIFTADTETIKDCERQLAALGVGCLLPPLSEDLLLEGLERKLSQVIEERGLSDAEVEARLPRAQRREAARLLRTMPHIALFVERDFPNLGSELDWREAVRRISSLEDWFLSTLTDDFDVWCFALTLALCQCAPFTPGVPWFEFEQFREMISSHLRRNLPVRDNQKPEQPALKDLISETPLLERCRAVVDKDPATGADMVRFADDSYPDRLWEVLLKSNRMILSLLLPVLKRAAAPTGDKREIESSSGQARRARASAILGRVGEIDPVRVTYALMGEWIATHDPAQQAAVGHLYQGIWASKNASYKEECLRQLGELVADGGEPEDAAEMRPMLWTAIAAYRQIGVYDLTLAMDKFRKITERYFAGAIENTSRVDRLLGRIEKALEEQERERSLGDLETLTLSIYQDILREIARRVFSQDRGILAAVQYAIVALCLTDDPIKVFDELLKWTRADRKSLGALVALMYLAHDGIASQLESRTIETEELTVEGRSKVYDCNLLVTAAASGEESVYRMAVFLTEVYNSFAKFYPPRSRTYFNKSFTIHLKNLVDSAMPVARVRAGIVHLFDELMLSESADLRGLVQDMAYEDPDFKYKGSKYFLFKKELQRRRLRLS